MTLTLAIVIVFGALAYAAVSDVASRRIPNSLPIIIALSFLIAGVAHPERVDMIGGLWVAAIIFFVGFLGFAFGKVGGGDVKLLAAAGLWAGPLAALDYLIVVGLVGGGLALLYLIPSIAHAMTWLRVTVEQRVPALQYVLLTGDVKKTGLPYGVAIASGGFYLLWTRYWVAG